MGALSAVLGYAIGTAQILFVDWGRNRRAHERQLRLIRAQLRQTRHRSASRFDWDPVSGPDSDSTPYPRRASSEYLAAVASADFYLTDEHDDDNMQQALFEVAEGAALLERYHADVLKLVEQLRTEDRPERRSVLRSRTIGTAKIYDKEAGRVEYIAQSALADVDRRLEEIRLPPQLRRTVSGGLPKGQNPKPLSGLDDPRLRGDAHGHKPGPE